MDIDYMKDKQLKGMTTARVAYTVCDMCNGNCGGSCGVNLLVENDAITGARGREGHPLSHGYICPKGRAIPEIINAPDRLKHPLIKTSGGRWRDISWEEAFGFITDRLRAIKSRHGAESLAVHVGHAGVRKEFTPYVERFCKVFGTPNFSTSGSHCYFSKLIANVLTCGGLPVSDYENSDCIVFWGYNPKESYPPLMKSVNDARKRGAKLIVVDPRTTSTARTADLHLQLRPGTDGALALAVLNVIVRENLYDKEFVEKWTVGFSELARFIEDYSPERVAEITWVPAEKIRKAAYLYSAAGPACISSGIASELLTNGVQAQRAISILQAITGNIDVAGGAIFASPPKLSPLAIQDTAERPAIGREKYPLFNKYINRAQSNLYSSAILEGEPYPIRGMIVTGSNPVLTWPNAGRLKKALAELEFLAVMDIFMTETAELADLVLPAAMFFERDELWEHSYITGEPRLGFAKKALANWNNMTDWKFWLELANRMGYKELFPWESEQEAIGFRLKPLGLSIEDLAHRPDGYIYGEQAEKKYEKEGFNTPSGKVEIYSEELKKYGYNPLPAYEEPGESFAVRPDIAKEYPFILTTGARTIGYIHSRFRNLPSLRKLAPEPWVEINRDKANELGIEEGELIIVESLRGSIELKARLTDSVDPRVICVPHGWAAANANLLTDDEVLDPISGFPSLRALPARIRKKNGTVITG